MPIDHLTPYVNFHELNDDWIIKTVKEVKDKTDDIDDAVSQSGLNAESARLSAAAALESETNAALYENSARLSADRAAALYDPLSARVDVNSARIDTFTQLTDGSTTGDAELMDIRVAADGEIYPTAGDAVRAQVTTLTDAIDDIAVKKVTHNLFDVDSIDTLIGSYRNASDTVVANNLFICTNMIDVSNISTIYCKQFNSSANTTFFQVLKYDANGDFIERSAITGGGPQGTTNDYTVGAEKYVRFNVEYPSAQSGQVPTLARSFMLATYPITYFEPFFDPYYAIEGVAIEKLDSANYKIYFGDASVKLFYTNDIATGSDNWNLGTVTLRSGTLVPAGTDILGPVKINEDTDFIGGVHGDETTNSVYFTIDGVFITPSQITHTITGKKLTLLLASDVYEQGTSTKAFARYVQVIFEPNKMTVSNTYVAAESLTLKRATNGGLFASYSSDIRAIAFNNAFYAYAPSSPVNIASNANTFATLFTKYGSATVRNIIGHESDNYTGYLQVFNNENPQRCKIYFDTYKNGSYTISSGTKITGTFEISFA